MASRTEACEVHALTKQAVFDLVCGLVNHSALRNPVLAFFCCVVIQQHTGIIGSILVHLRYNGDVGTSAAAATALIVALTFSFTMYWL